MKLKNLFITYKLYLIFVAIISATFGFLYSLQKGRLVAITVRIPIHNQLFQQEKSPEFFSSGSKLFFQHLYDEAASTCGQQINFHKIKTAYNVQLGKFELEINAVLPRSKVKRFYCFTNYIDNKLTRIAVSNLYRLKKSAILDIKQNTHLVKLDNNYINKISNDAAIPQFEKLDLLYKIKRNLKVDEGNVELSTDKLKGYSEVKLQKMFVREKNIKTSTPFFALIFMVLGLSCVLVMLLIIEIFRGS